MGPIKAMANILLDDAQSQHRDGVRTVISIMKSIGTYVGARSAEVKSENSLINNFFSVKSEF